VRRDAIRVLLLALVLVGVWQLGQGVWIYAKARLAQHLLQRAWARTLGGEADVKPWPWADTWPVARLRVPAHGADLIVLDGASGRTLAFAPGLAAGSARPGGPGTAIVGGHRDTHFGFLRRVRAGDEVIVDTPGQPPARFVVRETAIVDSRTALIQRDAGTAALALVTCYPFDAVQPGGPLRYVVVAEADDSTARPEPGRIERVGPAQAAGPARRAPSAEPGGRADDS
jgi:sortase A